jgi:hypothetical protein|tara:strand:+ start:1495 stop:2007 length:513 start_codon:yes stop_codon:yes gene_type:complete
MAINQAMCGSYKEEITVGIHFWMSHSRADAVSIAADTFKIAMFTSSRTDANEDLTAYTVTDEVTGTAYSAGGDTLAGPVTLDLADNASAVPTAFLDFADTTWASSTIANARCAMIYNSTLSTAGTAGDVTHSAYPTVCVLDFGGDKSSSAGDFTIQYPANDANNAIIRLA